MAQTIQTIQKTTSLVDENQAQTAVATQGFSRKGFSSKPPFEALAKLALHQLVEQQAERTPEAIAVLHRDTTLTGKTLNQTLTYEALNRQANQLAHYLISLGVEPEQLIAISLVRSPNMLVAFLGVLKAGAAYVPIDPDYPAVRRQYILSDADAQIVITQESLVSEFESEDDPPTIIQLDADADVLAQQPTHNPNIAIAPKQLAYVIYTSGSTGNPKGVMAHHQGLVNYSLALIEALELTAADRMLQFSTMSFDFIVSEVYPTLASGGSLALRTDEMMRSTQSFVDFIAEQKVTVIQFTTAFWHELVNGINRLGITLPPSLRLLLFGGEKASLSLCRQWVETVGDYPRLFNAYGPTETTVITTLYDAVAEGYDGSEDLPIGRAIRNAKTYVLDENLQPVAPGESGELCIGGPGVTHGYMKLPEKTAKAFCEDPFEPGERIYRTGDLVKMDETGLIQFVGRVDFQVKIRGYRIELGEIESCLDQYTGVHSRIVIAREDTPGDKRLVAYIVMQPEETLDREDLQAFMQEKLPKFMMPSAVVELEALPKNANGKIDRKALPAPGRQLNAQKIVPPKTELEAQLVNIWQAILGIEEIGITDNFFELGGNSLLVMRLFSELEASLNLTLPPTDIFTAPTVEQLAVRLESVMAADGKPDAMTVIAKQLKQAGSLISPLRIAQATTEQDIPADAPLFLVHDADGDIGLYLNLVRRIEQVKALKDRSVYAVKPRTAVDAPLAHSSIEQLAKDYVQQIRQVQPQGPYYVGGLCAGGILAFEMALQLEEMGESVVLTMMDAPAPGAKKRRGRVTKERLSRLASLFSKERSNPKKEAGQETEQEAGQAVKQGARKETKQTAPSPLKKLWQKGTNALRYEVFSKGQKALVSLKAHALRFCQTRNWSVPKVLQSLSIREVLVFAYEQYRPAHKLKGKVLLIRASCGNGSNSDRPYVEEYADPLFDWQALCESAIAAQDVPGGHSTMLRDENVAAIAQTLEKVVP